MLTKEIKQSLAKDRKARVEDAGLEIEAELSRGDPKSAFGKLKRWYRQTTGRPMKPTREDTETLRKERKELYTKAEDLPPMFDVIEVPATVDDSIPTEREIREAIGRLKNGKAPGPSGITAEHLKKWTSNRRTDPNQWELVTKVVEEAFRTG
jgi:coenzyme F420-reducing hydrogenase gamma subunit